MRLLALPLLFLAASVFAGEPAATPQAYALIVAGDGGEAQFTENYRDWSVRLHKALTDLGIPAANIRLLMEKKDLAPACNDVSTRENTLKTAGELIGKMKAGDQFSIFFIGHGSAQNKVGKLCLPGPDLSSDDVGALLDKVPTRELLLVNSTASSDSFLEKCSLPGRILITATNNSAEGNETYMMEFFLKGLENKAADADKNGAIDALEAFNYAATECPKWYLRQYFMKGSWRTEGKQSRALWEKFYGKVPDKKSAPAEDPNADDAEPKLGEWGEQWDSRRMPTEHAQLDDNGDRLGTAVFVNNEFLPLTGSEENNDSFYARKFVIGKPSGNTAAPAKPVPADGEKK